MSPSRKHNRRRARRGSVLIEQVTLLALLGIFAAITIRSGARLIDSVHVHGAARAVADLIALAREEAYATGARTAVRFDVPARRVVVHAGTDTIGRYDLGQHDDVQLDSSRDSIAYAPSGLGYGAANTRVILSKGASAETLTVSRLGRVKR
ncbi:MAG TPA: GspH/FimT family protein [Gemmatimonas sp.]|nr:GspH/FimT family protein [Gemmatimonas sp.]